MTETKKATELSMFVGPDHPGDALSDGAFVLHVSVQRDWVYAKVLTTDGHFRTRRYRHDQQVALRGTV